MFNKIIINLYLLAIFLSIYMPLKVYMLYTLTIFHFYFAIHALHYIKKNNYAINIYILLILLLLFIAIFMSGAFAYYAMVNIITILGIYYLIESEYRYLLPRLYKYIMFFSGINLAIYLYFPPDYIGIKFLGSIIIHRIQLDFLPLSITSILALLAFILSETLKSKLLMYIVKFINIVLILKLGKLSVIISLILLYILVFLLKYVYSKANITILNLHLKVFYIMLFFISFIIVLSKEYLDSTIITLLTFRDIIYKDFIEYTLNYGSILFGNGFINNSVKISEYATQPHNQALFIFFISGVFGLIIFLLIFLKILDNTLNSLKKGHDLPFKIFFTISLLMSMDSYFVLTTFPLYMIFIMFYLIKLPYIKNILNGYLFRWKKS